MVNNVVTKKPGLSAVKTGNAQLDTWIQRVVEIHEVEDGIRGRGDSLKWDSKPTFRDLIAIGLIVPTRNGQRQRYTGPPLPGVTPGVDPIEYDYSLPPAPTNVVAVGGFSTIFVSWDIPPQIPWFSHAEVWRSGEDNLGTAVLLGTTLASFYTDPVGGDGQTFYYWVRFVKNVLGTVIEGPFNGTAGTPGTAAEDPEYIIDQLTGMIQETHLYSALQTRIAGIEENAAAIEVVENIVDGVAAEYYVKTDVGGYVAGYGIYNEGPGASGFLVNADYFAVGKFGVGNDIPFMIGPVNGVNKIALNAATFIPDATITNAKIHTLAAEKLFATTGTIANAIIGTGHITNLMIGNTIQSNSYNPAGGVGWRIDKNGAIEVAQMVIRDTSGNVILSSGGTYAPAISNSNQQWSQISGAGKPADNATQNGITYSTAAPSGGVDGDFWYRTTTNRLYWRRAGAWEFIANDFTAVSSLANDAGYTDVTTYNQSTAPSSPSGGDFWFNPSTLTMSRYNLWTMSWEVVARAMSTIDQITPVNASTFIADLSVDTLQVAGNAISLPATITLTSGVTLTTFNTWYDVGSLTVNYGTRPTENVRLQATCNLTYSSGSGETIYQVRLMHGGVEYGLVQVSAPSGYSLSLVTADDIPGPLTGSQTFTMQVRRTSGGTIHVTGRRTLGALGTRK